MDDSLLVRMLDRRANLDKEPQPFLGRQRMLIAVICDLDATHQLHHEVRTTRVSGSGIKYLRNAGVVHQRERLTFGLEPGDHTLRVHPRLYDLECYAPPNWFFL